MKQLQKIKDWLADPKRKYSQGIDLLGQVGNNRILVRNLSKSESHYNKQKLLYELRKLAKVSLAIAAPTLKVKETPKPLAPIVPLIPPEIQQDDKEAVEKLEVALGKMHNKKGMLSNSLRSFDQNDAAGRKTVIDQIEGLDNDMQEIRVKLEYYQANGSLPPLPPKQKEKEIPDDPVKMQSMLLNQRTYRTKLNGYLKSPDLPDSKRKEYETKLDETVSIITEIERRLNSVGN